MKIKWLAIAFPVLGIVGCSLSDLNFNQSSQAVSAFDVNLYPVNKLVCDPFDGGSDQATYQGGLMAELYYRRDDQPKFTSLAPYFEEGVRSEQTLFFSQLFVPTRLFSLGFPTETGDMVKRDDGEVLNEWFALRFTSALGLGPDDEEGLYQLALLSDDGSILRIQENGEWIDVVDNDLNHPTRMGCGQVIEMKRGEQHLIQLDYYQGPRHHIALIPMWRKVDSLHPETDPLCGVQGNSTYFDFNNNSEPKQPYLDLLDRGWRPLDFANYSLPVQKAPFNPCVHGQAPVISNFMVEDMLDGVLRVAWTTDIPATSQVRYVDMATGAETLTLSDNILRTEHEIFVVGLAFGHHYLVQGVSISETYGKAISPASLVMVQ